MNEIELGAVQLKFADIVWEREPVSSGELVKVCERELNWKKPTTYTVLRKLCEKGILKNENGVVSSLIPRDEFYSAKSEQIIEESFNGSLPAFVNSTISCVSSSFGRYWLLEEITSVMISGPRDARYAFAPASLFSKPGVGVSQPFEE